jgi:4-amino-4-deoxy-L-arabinose transferase-like glycosyltransferase
MTELSASASFLQNRKLLWFVLGLTTLLFAIGNLPWRLDDYDQAKQAFTSFEMVKEGHWLYQRTPNEHAATKPPLVGWLSAAIFSATKSWAIAWRLPSFLTAIALLAFLFLTARKAYGQTAGLLAMSAFGLNLLSLRVATLVRTDMPLALVIFLLGWQIWEKIRRNEKWGVHDRFRAFVLLTASMLIKGPIVCAFLLPGIFVFEWRRRRYPTTASAWCGWLPWLGAFAIFILWVMGGIVLAHGFFHDVVLREFLGRFGETIHRAQPIFFYLPHLLHKFAPWSILGIALLILKWSVDRTHVAQWSQRASPEIIWLFLWSFGGLLVMSFIPSKRVDRIFPIVPPLCLLLAALFSRITAQEKLRSRAARWSAMAVVFALLFSTAYVATKVVDAFRHERDALVRFGHAVRKEADAHGWQYDVVGGDDEGLLLYLERPRFVKPDEVVAHWNAGTIDAVIAPEAERPRLLHDLEGSIPSRLRSWREDDHETPRYILLTRS